MNNFVNIYDIDFNNKRVILRCDLNVSMKDGKIIDDTRIISSLDTIKYLINNNAKVVILSHLGKVKTIDDKENKSLRLVFLKLKEYLGDKIDFVPFTSGDEVDNKVNNLKKGYCLLLENTRFEDLDNKKESDCNMDLAYYWASLGEIFVNDAFGTIHRKHASNYGISYYLDSCIGLLVDKELNELNKLDNPSKPFTVIMGGAKVSDKLQVIDSLIKKVDYLLIGGAMSSTFLKAKGINIGDSLYEEDYVSYCSDLLKKYDEKIILPIDAYGSSDLDRDKKLLRYEDFDNNFKAFDIGDETIKLFSDYILKSSCIFWNGPLGVYENDKYYIGTKKILDIISKSNSYSILGGGDIVSCCKLFGYEKDISYISTGGGASLEYLVNKDLDGLKNIKRK